MISVVIPTLNAAAVLPATLACLRDAGPLVREIVVSDGGSSDHTATIAREGGCRVVTDARGRGAQLAAGAAASSAPWLLFLHADTRLATGWTSAVGTFCEYPGNDRRAGYFSLALDDGAAAARRIEAIVAWRCRWLALPYGDQGLLIHADLYRAVGGFAALPLMEDVDLVRRLGRERLVELPATAITSAARYREGGYWRRPLRNLACLALYFIGMPPQHLVKLYE
jgi:rSAM/selenodomain-associated transferase 2